MKNTTFFSCYAFRRLILKKAPIVLTFLFSMQIATAADVIIGQYDFTTGANQLKATNVSSGVTMGDIVVGGTSPITAVYTGDALETSNWGTFMSISAGKNLNFSITKISPADSFNVSKVEIILKRTTANKLQLNYGATAAFGIKTYGSSTLFGTATYSTYTLTENTPVSGTNLIPFTTTSQSFAIGTMSASINEIVTIDQIKVYGKVSIPNAPIIATDIAMKRLFASKSHTVSFPVVISCTNAVAPIDLSITGTDQGYFSIDKSSISLDEITTPQTINVTYSASATGAHSANLHIATTSASSVEVPISTTCDLLFESFANYDATATSNTTLAGLPVLPDNVPLTYVPGWIGKKMYSFKAGSPNLASVCLGATSADSAYVTTPAMDLSQPFFVKFKVRSLAPNKDGRYSVLLDGNQIISKGVNSTSTLSKVVSMAFVGTSASKLTFIGEKNDTSTIIVDSIVVNYSTSPALNISLDKVINFGSVLNNTSQYFDFLIKGYNLAGDLAISLKHGSDFTLFSSSTISQATAISGTNITVTFDSPATSLEIVDTLIISSPNLANREITIKAKPDLSTSINSSLKTGKVIVDRNHIKILGYNGKSVAIYNISGVKVAELKNIGSSAVIKILHQGCYIVNIRSANSSISEKVIVQ